MAVACLVLGSLVQSTLGFGMGLVSIPLLVFSGVPLPTAIGLLLPNLDPCVVEDLHQAVHM